MLTKAYLTDLKFRVKQQYSDPKVFKMHAICFKMVIKLHEFLKLKELKFNIDGDRWCKILEFILNFY